MQQLLWSRGNGRELGTETNSCRIIFYSCLMLFSLDMHVLVLWYLRTVSYDKHNFMGLGWGEPPWVTRRFPALLWWAAWRALPLDWEKTTHFLLKRCARNSHWTFEEPLIGDAAEEDCRETLMEAIYLFCVPPLISFRSPEYRIGLNRNAIVTHCGGYLRKDLST